MHYLVIFLGAFLSEAAWTLWAYSLEKRQPVQAGIWAAAIVYLSWLAISYSIQEPLGIHCWAAGVGLGSFLIVWLRKVFHSWDRVRG